MSQPEVIQNQKQNGKKHSFTLHINLSFAFSFFLLIFGPSSRRHLWHVRLEYHFPLAWPVTIFDTPVGIHVVRAAQA